MTADHSQHRRNTRRRMPSPLITSACAALLLFGSGDAFAIEGRRRSSRPSCRGGHRTSKNNNCPGFALVPSFRIVGRSSIGAPRTTVAPARKRGDDYDDDDDDWDAYFDGDGDDEADDDYYNDRRPPRRGGRGRRRRSVDDLGTPPLTGSSPDDTSLSIPSSFGRGDTGLRLPSSVSAALLAGVFVLGIGTGVTVDSQINTNPKDLASRDAVDKNAPNPTLCTTYGASAMAFDQRVFVSFNPFNVYVAAADVKPACVLRPANVVPVLKERKLLDDAEVRGCKMNMNTWAFVGDLNDQPQLSCVYKSADAQNEFLEDPKRGIGEDYLDDDRAKIAASTGKKTGKLVKDGMTEAQKKMVLEMGKEATGGGGAGI